MQQTKTSPFLDNALLDIEILLEVVAVFVEILYYKYLRLITYSIKSLSVFM